MSILLSARFWLAGPVTFIVSIMVMLGMAIWFPEGAGQIDNMIFPMLLFPLIWAIIFFYSYLEKKLLRLGLVLAILMLTHVAMIGSHLMGGS